MGGWSSVPLWSLASEVRSVVDPMNLGPEVFHYSIPALEATGDGQVEDAAEIRSAKLRLRGDEVLISKLNPRKSRVLIARTSDRPVVASTEFVALRPRGVDPRFLFYLLCAEKTRQSLDAQVQSVTRSHQRVSPEDILRLVVSVPELEEQRRIANFLDSELSRMDRLKEVKESQVRLLRERAEASVASKVSSLFEECGAIPLRRIWTGVEQGWSPQCEDAEAEPESWAVLRTSAVSSGVFNPLAHKRLPADVEPDLRYAIHDGDLLLTRGSGSPAMVGIAAVANTGGRRLLLSDLLYRVRLQPEWPVSFAASILASRPVRDQISLLLRGQSGQTIKLRGQDIGEITVPLAPSDLRVSLTVDIESIYARHRHVARRIEGSLLLMRERRQTLITAAVTGKIDVTTARRVEA
ncbi:restriction endonuclease subunit S [Micromonospora sp. CPCC 205711]|uniref:restriction endonuclease subunit S n=1 Tax=Micromonospora sp. CPCC 205547 TaxID=3122400 RepID=UPI002FF07CAE